MALVADDDGAQVMARGLGDTVAPRGSRRHSDADQQRRAGPGGVVRLVHVVPAEGASLAGRQPAFPVHAVGEFQGFPAVAGRLAARAFSLSSPAAVTKAPTDSA
ncbi:hypothetical protein AMK11_31955 [Streptomyces sp. CB02414]|nr:hypothetical protein AMK11_31955 [Streptomyces sp. CB02414]